MVREHHGRADGYLPSPLVLATAMPARSKTPSITVAVVDLPLYRPVRLAEETVVLDRISRGRVSYVAAIGYRPEEDEMHGVDFHRRGAMAEQYLGDLPDAVSGEPFVLDGRGVQVAPPPLTPGGPHLAWGGGSPVAARRAGHLDRAWEELGPYRMPDVTSYAAINRHTGHSASLSFVSSVDELRAGDASHRIVTVEQAVALVRGGDTPAAAPVDRWAPARPRLAPSAHHGGRGTSRRRRLTGTRPVDGGRSPTGYQNEVSLVRPRAGNSPAMMGWQLPSPSAPVSRSRTRTTVSRIWCNCRARSGSLQSDSRSPSTTSSPRHSPWWWPCQPK